MRRRCLNKQQNQLVLGNMGLAYGFARAYKWHPRYEDILQACLLGLCEAALRWEPSRGAFSTCAHYWMRNCTGTELKDPELVLATDIFELRGSSDQEEFLASMLHTSYTRRVLLRLVHELPENERHVVLLKYPLDPYSKTYNDVDIATMLDCSPTWVGNLRRRAFCKLRKGLIREEV